MAFIPIDAKADVENSKKGKLTPAQHAQLNAWCLSNKSGILDCLNKCEYNPTASNLNIVNNQINIVFKSGYIVICGRLIECEANTEVTLNMASAGNSGYVIARYDLSGVGNEEFKIDIKSGTVLTQTDLNEDSSTHNVPTTGTYELPLYRYTVSNNAVTLTRNTGYISDIGGKLEETISSIIGTGMVGNPLLTPPLQDYNKRLGTIENRLSPLNAYNNSKGTVEARLTALGFSEGDATNLNYVSNVTLKKLGKFVVCRFTYTNNRFSFSLPSGYAPYSTFSVKGLGSEYSELLYRIVPVEIDITIDSNGTISSSNASFFGTNKTVQFGWSTDSHYEI